MEDDTTLMEQESQEPENPAELEKEVQPPMKKSPKLWIVGGVIVLVIILFFSIAIAYLLNYFTAPDENINLNRINNDTLKHMHCLANCPFIINNQTGDYIDQQCVNSCTIAYPLPTYEEIEEFPNELVYPDFEPCLEISIQFEFQQCVNEKLDDYPEIINFTNSN